MIPPTGFCKGNYTSVDGQCSWPSPNRKGNRIEDGLFHDQCAPRMGLKLTRSRLLLAIALIIGLLTLGVNVLVRSVLATNRGHRARARRSQSRISR
jgi:hypothetical protein